MTIPRGDIRVEVGSPPFDIFCRLNPAHPYTPLFGSRALGLYLAGAEGGEVRMDTTVVNATTIRGRFDPGLDMRLDLVSCRIDAGAGTLKGVCNQNVYVGGESRNFVERLEKKTLYKIDSR